VSGSEEKEHWNVGTAYWGLGFVWHVAQRAVSSSSRAQIAAHQLARGAWQKGQWLGMGMGRPRRTGGRRPPPPHVHVPPATSHQPPGPPPTTPRPHCRVIINCASYTLHTATRRALLFATCCRAAPQSARSLLSPHAQGVLPRRQTPVASPLAGLSPPDVLSSLRQHLDRQPPRCYRGTAAGCPIGP
jgi:hypothetical protein